MATDDTHNVLCNASDNLAKIVPSASLDARRSPNDSNVEVSLDLITAQLEEAVRHGMANKDGPRSAHYEKDATHALALLPRYVGTDKAKLNALGAKKGVISSILHLMRIYEDSFKVCEKAVGAIGLLCRYGDHKSTRSEENMRRLGEAGACEAVSAALTRHGQEHVSIAEKVFVVMGSLSLHKIMI